MRKFSVLFLLLAFFSIFSINSRELQIFRNDNSFNCLELDENLKISHKTGETTSLIIHHNDFYNPESETVIPIEAIDSCRVKESTVPSLHFSFPDYPDAEWVWDKENYISATLDVEGKGLFDDLQNLELSVKGRGNTTWGYEKKPMRLKFSKKTSICGFKKAKSYVLLADYLDPSMMKNVVGHWIARKVGAKFANHTQPCNVYVNGKYQGLYLLTEKIGINSSSVDIDETTGILFEFSLEMDEKYRFYSKTYNFPVMVKDPDFDELYENDQTMTPQERFEMWQNDFNKAEELVMNGRGLEAFDIDSYVSYILVENILYNIDLGWPKSAYIYKENIDEKYKFGPVWDLDLTCNFFYGSANYVGEIPPSLGNPVETPYNQRLWLKGILSKFRTYPEVKEAYKKKLDVFDSEIFPELLKFIDSYALIIESSAKMDAMRWPTEYIDLWNHRVSSFDRATHVEHLKAWLMARMDYIRSQGENF